MLRSPRSEPRKTVTICIAVTLALLSGCRTGNHGAAARRLEFSGAAPAAAGPSGTDVTSAAGPGVAEPGLAAAASGELSPPDASETSAGLLAPEAVLEPGAGQTVATDDAGLLEGSTEGEVLPPPEGRTPEDTSAVDEQFLRAVLENHQAQLATVTNRISYPDELSGGALVLSPHKPGEVTFFYPLKAVGGVTVEIGKDHAVKVTAPADAAVKPLLDTVQKYLDPDKEKVSWYQTRNMLEISALEENVPFILDLLEFLDSPPDQIMIEAAVWEITDVHDEQLGSRVELDKRTGARTFFNLFNTRFDTQAFLDTLTSGQPYQGGTLDFITAADAHGARMHLVFQFLKNQGLADLVSKPRMLVSVGQTAKIMTGEQVPIQSVKLISGRLELGGNTVYKDVGVQLYVTPITASRNAITMSVLPVVSEVIGYSEPGPNGVPNPIIATREADTKVTVANGELIAIGGLLQTKKVLQETKVPILGDIPILGHLFKSTRRQSKKVELWFTVQPTFAEHRIVRPELTGRSLTAPAGGKPLPK